LRNYPETVFKQEKGQLEFFQGTRNFAYLKISGTYGNAVKSKVVNRLGGNWGWGTFRLTLIRDFMFFVKGKGRGIFSLKFEKISDFFLFFSCEKYFARYN